MTEVPSKADPETLVLRGSPRRAVRFRRGVIIATAAAGATAIIGVAWLALDPPALRLAASEDSRTEVETRAPAEALAGAPQSYGDVPQLGPPLPGDLGRPILKHRRETAMAAADPAAHPAQDTERQRIEAERRAARQSGVMMQLGGSARPTVSSSATAPVAALEEQAARRALDPERDPNGQQRKLDFVKERDTEGDINPHALTPAVSPYMLSAGSVIAASLITGINSDLPGLVTAQVTENVHDSATGRILLIPQGARLIGSYDSVVAFGQRRALVVWQRIILPDGSALRIDNVPATDPSGYAGLEDKVDFHSWSLLKGVALSTLLGVGSELAISGDSDLVEAVRRSTQDSATRAGDRIVARHLDVQPTIAIRPGTSVRLVVHKDLLLSPWRAREE